MASFVGTNTPLTSKAISKESEEPFKFKAKTTLGTGLITAVTGAVSLLTPGDAITAAGIFPAGTVVVSVDVAKKEAVLSKNAIKAGAAENLEIATPVFKPYIFTSPVGRTDFAEFIVGQFFTEQGGTLEVQQSFDYPSKTRVDDYDEALEGVHWDVVTKIELSKAEAEEGPGKGFQIFALAPTFRLVFTNGEAASEEVRIYGRAQEKGRV